jgi:hypothetical protein
MKKIPKSGALFLLRLAFSVKKRKDGPWQGDGRIR